MKILYHHRTQAEDAQGIHIREMGRAFEALGHSVHMVAMVKPSHKEGASRPGLVSKLRSHLPAWFYEFIALGYNFYGYVALRRAIKLNRPDFIYERYALNAFCGLLAARRFGIPLISEVNAPLAYEQERYTKLAFRRVAYFLERWICSNAQKTIAVSTPLKEILVREGVPVEKIVVMPNGISQEVFKRKIDGSQIREKYSLGGKTVVGFVGWFKPWHGLDLLLEAFSRIENPAGSFHCLLVGDGPVGEDLRKLAEKKNLHEHVTFTGPIDSALIPEHLAAIDIAVLPRATAYASPIKLFEYMAMGKAVVAPRQANITEVVAHQTNAELFNPEDCESLQASLTQLMENPEYRRRLGEEASRTIEQRRYFWIANAERVIDIVRAL